MFVLVMNVGKVRVGMRQRFVGVRMRMRLAAVPIEIVYVLMMDIVDVWVGVRNRFMRVHVFVTFG